MEERVGMGSGERVSLLEASCILNLVSDPSETLLSPSSPGSFSVSRFSLNL